MALKKQCSKSGCNELCDMGQKYCEKHVDAKTVRREGNRYYDMNIRDREAVEFYRSKEWLKVRKVALVRDNYLCVKCLEDMKFSRYDVVDHMLPREWFPELALRVDNLQCLCHMHHNGKTAEDEKKYGKRNNNNMKKY
ncbi:HNH endonuclease [Paenibacillus sp. 19GGS1-52]|uniref:HNH endonuclease n=1 Tax=Paenibacillus sp. 19GGS1-52 TaxID=2758563 RepID=UPI001EFBC648|nr:HNH endonuclease [Paenibacillus sp. 19GGS1-52]ULO09660.1 HNH endonuclease [Paenibacillus sp. 19GGS1-52]